MQFQLREKTVFAGNGAVALDPARPTTVFLHGAGMDHTVWAEQTRWLSHRGCNVLAFDFPGHGGSDGPVLLTIDALADWTADALDHLGLASATIVGHSMGALAALAFAARHPAKTSALVLMGAALDMPVSQELLEAAQANDHAAIAMVNLWGYGARASLGGAQTPGVWMIGAGDALLSQAAPGVLHKDLSACNAFKSGADYAARIQCPAHIIQGARDKMAPLKGARALAAAIKDARLSVIEEAGHMVMFEEARAVRQAMRDNAA